MIAHLRGLLIEKHPHQAIVDCGGVGYDVAIPVSTFTSLPGSGTVSLHIHTVVREDAIALFGFATRGEKEMFEKLITVSGIGPKLAVTALSGMASEDLVTAIRAGDITRLTRIPGVGKKTAERMVVELRDKLGAAGVSVPATPPLSSLDQDVLSALLNLGCARPAAEAALAKMKAAGEDLDFETYFRRALELVR
jgi:Holliday junction DNA helicase RuvA